MKLNSFWKNIALLTLGTVFALHIQMSHAQDDTSSTSGDEECVIKDDQLQDESSITCDWSRTDQLF